MRLYDACTTHLGYTARSRFEPAADGGVPVIQLRDLSEQGVIDPSGLARVQLGDRVDRYAVQMGDVLFKSRGELNVAVALDERFVEPAIAILPLMILHPKQTIVLPEYLAWAINQPAAQRQLGVNAQGTGLRMVPKSSLDALDIDVPDLATQHRIVCVADLAAREEALLHQLAATKRTLTSHLLAERAKGQRNETKTKESRE